jgi:hypothetical protein
MLTPRHKWPHGRSLYLQAMRPIINTPYASVFLLSFDLPAKLSFCTVGAHTQGFEGLAKLLAVENCAAWQRLLRQTTHGCQPEMKMAQRKSTKHCHIRNQRHLQQQRTGHRKKDLSPYSSRPSPSNPSYPSYPSYPAHPAHPTQRQPRRRNLTLSLNHSHGKVSRLPFCRLPSD